MDEFFGLKGLNNKQMVLYYNNDEECRDMSAQFDNWKKWINLFTVRDCVLRESLSLHYNEPSRDKR